MKALTVRLGRATLTLDLSDAQADALGTTEARATGADCDERGLTLHLPRKLFLVYDDMHEYWERQAFGPVQFHGERALIVFADFMQWRINRVADQAAELIRNGTLHPATLYEDYPQIAEHPTVAPAIVRRVCTGNLPPKPKTTKKTPGAIELYRWFAWYRREVDAGRMRVKGSLYAFTVGRHPDLIPESWGKPPAFSDPADNLKKMVKAIDQDERYSDA